MTHEEVFNSNIKIAYKIVQQYRNCGIEYEDLKQIALLGLWKATMTYDKDRKIAFSTYSYRVIYNEINSYLRNNKKCLTDRHLSEEITDKITLGDMLVDEENAMEKVEIKIDMEKCMCATNSKDKTIFKMLLNGETQIKIADKLGTSQVQINRDIKKLKSKIIGENKA